MHIVILGAGTAGLISALMIREKYPFATIDIIKSGEIGIVGVGEGSTEHWNEFVNFVGLDYLEIMYKTKATVKIGILFKDWNIGEEYIHSVGIHKLSPLDRPDFYHHLYLNNTADKFPLAPYFQDTFYKNLLPLNRELSVSNQYHFDTFKLNDYLQEVCTRRNIIISDCIVTDVLQDSEGNITGLQTEGKLFTGDLFIDCSGLKRVISSKIGIKYISKAEYLPMNHAIAFPTELNNPDVIEPYTLTTALSSGWMWKIPTQERYGNGYVFSDSYLTADQALGEANKHLGKNIEKAARDIKFTPGRVDKFWDKNVVNIGLSSSFAEPLEAQSIGFTVIQARTLIEYLDLWPADKEVSKKYNERMNICFDNIIDFLQAHYLTNRENSKFWKDKPFKLTDFNREYIPLFKQGVITPTVFRRNTDLMFHVANWYQLIGGLKLIDRELLIKSLENNRESYNINNERFQRERLEETKPHLVIPHRQQLDLINLNYEYRNRKNEN